MPGSRLIMLVLKLPRDPSSLASSVTVADGNGGCHPGWSQCAASGVDPVLWTPERLRATGPRREFTCHGPVRRIRRSSALKRSG
jgi:hypothetical protein